MTAGSGTDTLTVCYNGGCPICRAEIDHYRAQAGDRAALAFVDVAHAAGPPFPAGLAGEAGLRRLHALTAQGQLLAGVDAFIAIWERLPRYRWLARLVRLPLVRGLVGFGYDRVAAPLLFELHRRRQRRSTHSMI